MFHIKQGRESEAVFAEECTGWWCFFSAVYQPSFQARALSWTLLGPPSSCSPSLHRACRFPPCQSLSLILPAVPSQQRKKSHFFSQFNLSAQTVHRSSGNRDNLPQEQWQLSIDILLCDGVLDTRNFISSTIVLLLFPFSDVKWWLANLK